MLQAFKCPSCEAPVNYEGKDFMACKFCGVEMRIKPQENNIDIDIDTVNIQNININQSQILNVPYRQQSNGCSVFVWVGIIILSLLLGGVFVLSLIGNLANPKSKPNYSPTPPAANRAPNQN